MSIINIGIIITYIMILGATLTVAVFSILQMIKNPEKAIKTIYTIGGLIFVFITAYILSSLLDGPVDWGFNLVEKRVSVSLYLFYILLIGAIAAVIYSGIEKALKK